MTAERAGDDGAGWVITKEQRDRFDQDGLLLVPDAVPAELLARWRDLAADFEQAALVEHGRGARRQGACVIEDPVGPRLMRQDDVLAHAPEAVLDLLATPAMMAIARDLSGQGTVPLSIDVLYKHQHPHPVILWHQGAQHPRGHAYLNVGIYLDDAGSGDGCLVYVPGTQGRAQDIGGLVSAHGWDVPGVVEQPAAAGDIIVQDMMVLHGSPPKRSDGVRRTIYVEFRPADGIRESAAQSQGWIELRQRWMAMVLERANDRDWPASWRSEARRDLGPIPDEVAALMASWEPPIPSVYGDAVHLQTVDYPVPRDLLGGSHAGH